MAMIEQPVNIENNLTNQNTPKKRVLVVSYLFPPAGDVGVHRTLRFIKWLPQWKWEPVVLTAANAKVNYLDSTLEQKISKDVEVHYTASFERLNYGTSLDGQKTNKSQSIVGKIFQELPRDLWKAFTYPDDKVGWIRPAIEQARELHQQRPFDLIYVTGKPFSSFRIGEVLAKEFNIPWMMDYRDLWTINRRRKASGIRHQLESRLEARFLKNATAVIVNTPDNRNDFIRNFNQIPAKKFHAITNGFDRNDFEELSTNKYEKFTIAYGGTFYFQSAKRTSLYRKLLGFDQRKAKVMETYSPLYFFNALQQLFHEHPEIKANFKMIFSGAGCKKIEQLIKEHQLEDNIELKGWLDYHDSLQILKSSHAQLLVLSRGEESKGWIPSKLYQYLGTGNPILALIPPGDVEQIIKKTQTGIVCPPDQVQQIKSAIEKLYRSYEHNQAITSRCQESVQEYEGEILTKKLAKCFDIALGTHH
ncbi:Hypothetical protein PBC10988_35980 [Planctomycetales bacterium 10988]|nr:Hypothetical protein PBC10988_35980 [Planctomycetales bacterium 10988]